MNRLRAFRDIEGINQEELGKILGLSAAMVSAIESGRRLFAGDLGLIGYSDNRLTLPSMSEPLHRHRASTGVTAKKRAKELLRLGGEAFAELNSRTAGSPKWSLEHPIPVTSLEDLEDLAIEVRCMIEHEETGPIQNLTSAVERAGICLIPIVGLNGIDGLSSWVDGVPVIGIAPNLPGDRFRFTLAHEIGHLLLHVRKTELAESQANRFAGALLFPRSEFDAAMPERPQLRDFIALKSSWGVAVAAIVYRAHELDYLDDSRYRAIQIQMSKWRKHEPGTFAPAHGTLFPRLVEVNGGIDNVSASLGMNRRHMAELSNWSHLRAA